MGKFVDQRYLTIYWRTALSTSRLEICTILHSLEKAFPWTTCRPSKLVTSVLKWLPTEWETDSPNSLQWIEVLLATRNRTGFAYTFRVIRNPSGGCCGVLQFNQTTVSKLMNALYGKIKNVQRIVCWFILYSVMQCYGSMGSMSLYRSGRGVLRCHNVILICQWCSASFDQS